MSPTVLNKYFSVDNMMVSSYLARCKRVGKPITSKFGHLSRYRPLDVVARARAELCKITRVADDYEMYKEKIVKLKVEVAELEDRRSRAIHILSQDKISNRLTSMGMLLEKEIVSHSNGHVGQFVGVYFLVHKNAVIYVGQSTNVCARVSNHKNEGIKSFETFAFIPCEKEELDILESLYIHALNPSDQGRSSRGKLSAPHSMRKIMELGNNIEREKYDG
tara:strand:- start:33 stop:692 length:660 start_codon:yes stop_codon:yes gene_type:complete